MRHGNGVSMKVYEKWEYSWIINMVSFCVEFWCPHRFENADDHAFTTHLTMLKLTETEHWEFVSTKDNMTSKTLVNFVGDD